MKKLRVILCAVLFVFGVEGVNLAFGDHTPDPSSVTIAGSLQSELGCPGDWQPDCAATYLTYDAGDEVWQGTFPVPAGDWEYKAALNDSWDENYGANAQQNGPNIPLYISELADVKFFYDHKSHWITDNVNSVIATVPGSFQDELGCPGDWQPDCLRSWLQDTDGDGIYSFSTSDIPAGDYEAKVAHNESWDESYGAGGEANGSNIPFTVTANDTVKFEYDPATHVLMIIIGNIEIDPAELSVSQGADVQTTRPMTIINNSDIALEWNIVEDDGACDSPTDIPWLSTSPDTGTTIPEANTVVEVVFDSTGLAHGDYSANLCVNSNDPSKPLIQVPVTLTVGLQTPATYAVIHYFREDDDYGNHTTGDYNDYWGLHMWEDIDEIIEWTASKPFLGEDEYGRFAWGKLAANATKVGFIVHRGDTKDGTTADRFFNPGVNPEIWLRNDDANIYTSQAEAQGFVTIHYHRDDGDYGDPTSSDFNDFWGLHLWGDAINPSEATGWTAPKKPTGLNDYGAFWDILIVDASQPVNFIVHRGDQKDPGPDQSFVPAGDATIWLKSGDETIYSQRGAAEDFAILHYHRADGDYGDPTSSDFNDFWGLHVWTGALIPNPTWQDPERWDSLDNFGPAFKIDLVAGAPELAYIIHRGDNKDPGPDQFLELDTWGYEVWQIEGEGPNPEVPHYVLPVSAVAEVNNPPTVTADEATVIVNEGNTAANSGTAADINGDTLALSSSTGTVIYNNDGTWSWSFVANDGPDDSQMVTITADDGKGGIGQTAFALSVNNVAPTINSVNNNGPILQGGVVEISVDASDPAGISDPLTYSFDCNDDGVFEIGPQTAAIAICNFNMVGEYTVNAWVVDDDGGVTSGSTMVTVLTPQEAIDDFIVAEIEDLVADGDLNQGQGNSLLVKLYHAIQELNQGKINVAINLLGAFLNQVNDFINEGVLTPEEGQVLIDAANEIIEAING